MDSIRNFLESSTIHGLSYISSSKVLPVRLFWILVVFGGFTVAGFLIHSSLLAWLPGSGENRKPGPVTTGSLSPVIFPGSAHITRCFSYWSPALAATNQ